RQQMLLLPCGISIAYTFFPQPASLQPPESASSVPHRKSRFLVGRGDLLGRTGWVARAPLLETHDSCLSREGAMQLSLPLRWFLLEVRELRLAIISEGEGVDGEAGPARDEFDRVAPERRILHQVVHPRLVHLDIGMPARVELHVYPLIRSGQIFAVLLDVE